MVPITRMAADLSLQFHILMLANFDFTSLIGATALTFTPSKAQHVINWSFRRILGDLLCHIVAVHR